MENREHKIGVNIIENIDNNGYLISSIEDIAKSTNSSIEEVEIILNIIQNFDPSGVGARNLKECLLIQVRDRKDINKYIVEIIENYLEDLGHNRIQKIAKALDIETYEVQEACDYIRQLEPKPGRAFGNNQDLGYIIPDAEIKLINGELEVILNDVTGPRLEDKQLIMGHS